MGKEFCQCLLILHSQSSSTEELSVCGEPLATQPDLLKEDRSLWHATSPYVYVYSNKPLLCCSDVSDNESVLSESNQLNNSIVSKHSENDTDTAA
jgi:hypothetical protein